MCISKIACCFRLLLLLLFFCLLINKANFVLMLSVYIGTRQKGQCCQYGTKALWTSRLKPERFLSFYHGSWVLIGQTKQSLVLHPIKIQQDPCQHVRLWRKSKQLSWRPPSPWASPRTSPQASPISDITIDNDQPWSIDDHAKDGGRGVVWLYVVFTMILCALRL